MQLGNSFIQTFWLLIVSSAGQLHRISTKSQNIQALTNKVGTTQGSVTYIDNPTPTCVSPIKLFLILAHFTGTSGKPALYNVHGKHYSLALAVKRTNGSMGSCTILTA